MKLWQPHQDRITQSNIYQFQKILSQKYQQDFSDYQNLWRWSVEQKNDFWQELLSFTKIKTKKQSGVAYQPHPDFIKSAFFPDYSLNYSENLLYNPNKQQIAILFNNENKDKVQWSWQELTEKTALLVDYFRQIGIQKGDRIAAYIPNIPEAICSMLATASLGGVFVSCSPDFGVEGVLDRFSQVEPKILLTCPEYFYAGKRIDIREKIIKITEKLPSLKAKIHFSYPAQKPLALKGFVSAEEIFQSTPPTLRFEEVGFNHPLYILFSSGTTSVPKCIVHSTGGSLLQQTKELQLHTDLKQGEKIFFFTTCGWMMWNWLVPALASNATVCLYDGSPFHPHPAHLFEYVAEQKIHFLGLGAKIIDFYQKHALPIRKKYDLASLRAILSTASVLSEECFEYVYNNVKEDLHLVSMSGGTDIVSCFVLGNPTIPVYRGELQAAGLGMDIDVFSPEGKPTDQKGELVCKTPFPSKPICFWNDPSNKKYKDSYFSKFPNIWTHGDYTQKTKNNGFIIYGRSDTTLNPSGVRIGTAEIYRCVEKIPEITESIVVGQNWKNDIRIVLFVKLAPKTILDEELKTKIKQQILQNLTARHLPKKIISVPDIPRTRSGKITELAVKRTIEGETIQNLEALANPDCLQYYQNIEELKN